MKNKVQGSIDNSHREKTKEFTDNEMRINKLKNKLLTLEKEKNSKPLTVFESLEYDEHIHDIQIELKKLVQNDPIQYLLNVSDIFKRYNEETVLQNEFQDDIEKKHMNNFIHTKTSNMRGQLYQEYMDVVQNKPNINQLVKDNGNIHKPIYCTTCNNVMTMAVNETHMLCSQCGLYEIFFEPSVSGLTYEQEIHTETNIHFAYKRINHLRELLSQLQAKETSDVPDEILDKVRAEFKKARIKNTSEITQNRVKSYLKKLGLNKYYEHTRQITNCLNGKPPPVISNELYENFINMFTEIQEPFEKVCPKNRKNFFSYNYILYKFCELLGEYESMQLFPLLKSREKLYQQDCIWKDICQLLGWVYYKSV